MTQAANPIVPWIGGKRRLAKHLLPLFPAHTCYVEPFCGAAALYWRKEPSHVEVLNDVNGELINLYRVVKHHLEEFLRQFKWALTSREIYRWQQLTNPATLPDVQRAARWFYLQKLAFGGKVTGQTYGTAASAPARFNLMRIEEELSAAHMRLARTQIERLGWAECMTRYDRPHTLFFCDPPYWETEGYGVDFPLAEYEQLASLAASMKGRLILTVNDHPEMRRVFKRLHCREVAINYTVSGSHKPAARGELILTNFRPEKS